LCAAEKFTAGRIAGFHGPLTHEHGCSRTSARFHGPIMGDRMDLRGVTVVAATGSSAREERSSSWPHGGGATGDDDRSDQSMATTRKTTTKAPARKAPARKAAPATRKTVPAKARRAPAATEPTPAEYVAEVVRRTREAAGLTTKELAERMGTSDGAVRRIEDARTNCTVATLANVAQALGGKLTIGF
jgi:hypothetical protein